MGKNTRDQETDVNELSEKTLREEEGRLSRILEAGNATVRVANRLADVRAARRRIEQVRFAL